MLVRRCNPCATLAYIGAGERFIIAVGADNRSSAMKHGMYCGNGPYMKLRYKGAILRQDPETKENYLAQFDDKCLHEAFGWHSFPKDHFINITE